MEFSVGLTASGQCFKLNLSLIISSEIQVRGGLKNDPIRRGMWIFSGITLYTMK